jgi:nucleoid-associated protein YgaU
MGFLDALFGKKKSSGSSVRETIKVGPGETLEDIAAREYGDANKWEVIFQKNKWRFDGEDPKTIYPGMDLDIPEIEEN